MAILFHLHCRSVQPGFSYWLYLGGLGQVSTLSAPVPSHIWWSVRLDDLQRPLQLPNSTTLTPYLKPMSLSCLSSHFSLCVLMVTASFQSPNSSLKSQYILELISFPYSQSGVNFWQGVYYPPSFSRFFATCCHPAKSFYYFMFK